MKKILFIITLSLTIFIFGCNISKNNEKQLTFDFEIKQVNIYKDSNEVYDSEYNVYTMNNQDEINSLVNSLKNIKYNEKQSKSSLDEQTYMFVINLKDKYDILVIGNSNFILHTNSFYKICEVITGDFDFLNSIEFGEKVETVTPEYNSEDLDMIILEYNNMNINLTSNHYVKELLLKTKFYINENSNDDVELLFVLHLGNKKTLSIYENGIVGYSDSSTEIEQKYKLKNNEFDVIKDVIEGEILSFSFESYETITVYNNEDVSVQIKETEQFIKSFDNIKYIKVKDFKQYTLGDMKYKLNIDGSIIGIYNSNMIIINDTLYIVTEGNFDFLDEIKFNTSSGWLPWV